jgi:hypothetical protein
LHDQESLGKNGIPLVKRLEKPLELPIKQEPFAALVKLCNISTGYSSPPITEVGFQCLGLLDKLFYTT